MKQLSKSQFKQHIDTIKETLTYENEQDSLTYIRKYPEDNDECLRLIDGIIQLLELMFNDDCLIFSWIFDKDFGRNLTSYSTFPETIKTTDDLYDYLCVSKPV